MDIVHNTGMVYKNSILLPYNKTKIDSFKKYGSLHVILCFMWGCSQFGIGFLFFLMFFGLSQKIASWAVRLFFFSCWQIADCAAKANS